MLNINRFNKILTYNSLTYLLSFYRHFTPRRALLYVPGDDLKKLNKALNLDVDCIAMDCEDGVALNKKNEARSLIKNILNENRPRNYDLSVRLNSIDTDFFEKDISVICSGQNLPDTLLLPKVNHTEHLKQFSDQLKHTMTCKKPINLIIYIESPLAFVNLTEICKTAHLLGEKTSNFTPVALVFGSDDFCANLGAARTKNSIEVLYARQKLVLVAKAFNLQAIDMVDIDFKDLEGLKIRAKEGALMGYTGKQVIHPGQVPIVQEAFLPNEKEIEWASGLLEAFEKHQTTGQGAFTYRGSMIDMPTMKQAQNVMDLVEKKRK